MRKVRLDVKCQLPSWNFCNKDIGASDFRRSKELCKFCAMSTAGPYCLLHDEYLTVSQALVHKTNKCIKITAGLVNAVDEPEPLPTIDPQVIIRETLKQYNKTVDSLIKQGYPRSLAEQAAVKYVTGEDD